MTPTIEYVDFLVDGHAPAPLAGLRPDQIESECMREASANVGGGHGG